MLFFLTPQVSLDRMLRKHRLVTHCNSTMSKARQVRISRDGLDLGCYDAHEAVRLLISGTLRETDLCWEDGAAGWERFAEYVARAKNGTAKIQDDPSAYPWMTPPRPIQVSFDCEVGEHRASDRQREIISSFGITLHDFISEFEASRWIDQLSTNDAAVSHKSALEFKRLLNQHTQNENHK